MKNILGYQMIHLTHPHIQEGAFHVHSLYAGGGPASIKGRPAKSAPHSRL